MKNTLIFHKHNSRIYRLGGATQFVFPLRIHGKSTYRVHDRGLKNLQRFISESLRKQNKYSLLRNENQAQISVFCMSLSLLESFIRMMPSTKLNDAEKNEKKNHEIGRTKINERNDFDVLQLKPAIFFFSFLSLAFSFSIASHISSHYKHEPYITEYLNFTKSVIKFDGFFGLEKFSPLISMMGVYVLEFCKTFLYVQCMPCMNAL